MYGGNSLMEPCENIQGGISYLMRWMQLGWTTTLIAFAPQVSISRYLKKILTLCMPGAT